jgi:hypothetical protein
MHSEAHTPNSASSDDVGRAEVYKAELVHAQAGNSEYIVNVNQYSWRVTLVYRRCPRIKGRFSSRTENRYIREWQSH